MILLIVVIILLIYLFLGSKCFNIIDSFENSSKKRQCCLIKKSYDENNNGLYKGKFKYKYQKLEDEACNMSLYDQNSNQQLFVDGENDWDNNLCKEENNKIGSCRRNNKECVDFSQKKECDKYHMNWHNQSCHNAIPFVFTDNVVKPPSLEDIDPNVMTYDKIKKDKSLNDLFPASKKQIIDLSNEYSTKKNESLSILV